VRSRRAAATFAMFFASFPRRAMMPSLTAPVTESARTRWTASISAQRSSRDPCLVTCPRATLVDSRCRGVSPAHEHSCLTADPVTGIITAEKLTRAAGAENSGAAVAAEFVAAVTAADRHDDHDNDGSGSPFAWYGDSAYGTGDLRAIPGECRSARRCSRSGGTRARLRSPAAAARKEGAARRATRQRRPPGLRPGR
jgi:hypothetical protein